MPQIGWFEILIIVSIAIIVVGPKDFPIMLKKVGSWIGSAKRYVSDIQNQVTNVTEEKFDNIDEKSKTDNTHNRRLCFSKLRNKIAVATLFDEVAKKIGDRPGGYTRIIKLGNRMGDNASMAMIEFVDYNEIYSQNNKSSKKESSKKESPKKESPKKESK